MKILSNNCWSLDSFCYIPNNLYYVSHKITETNIEKANSKELNSSQSSNNISILYRVRWNNAVRLIIMGHLNINSLRNKFEILQEIVHDK